MKVIKLFAAVHIFNLMNAAGLYLLSFLFFIRNNIKKISNYTSLNVFRKYTPLFTIKDLLTPKKKLQRMNHYTALKRCQTISTRSENRILGMLTRFNDKHFTYNSNVNFFTDFVCGFVA